MYSYQIVAKIAFRDQNDDQKKSNGAWYTPFAP